MQMFLAANFLQNGISSYSSNQGGSREHISIITIMFFWPDLICLQILLLPYSPASLYPSIPRYRNSFHRRHFHCSVKAWLLQLSLSQPAQVSDHPAPTDPELSRTCCCQSSQIQSHHSHPPVSTLAKDKWAHWTQAPLTYLQSSHNHPTFCITSSQFSLLAALALHLWSHSLVNPHHLLYE